MDKIINFNINRKFREKKSVRERIMMEPTLSYTIYAIQKHSAHNYILQEVIQEVISFIYPLVVINENFVVHAL